MRASPRRLLRSVADEIQIDVSEHKGIRYLHLAQDDVQSAMRVKSPNELILAYSRVMMGILLFNKAPQNAALIGLGGGSLAKFIYHYLPQLALQVAERYPEVITTARALFFLPENNEHLQVQAIAGEDFIPALSLPMDIIFHDAFSATGIVQSLVSEAFLQLCFDKLSLQGALVINLWGSDKYTPVYIERIKRIFTGGVLILPAFPDKNRIVYAFKTRPHIVQWHVLEAHAKELEQAYPLNFSGLVSALSEYNAHDEKRLLL
jgi:spermidine synthase